MTEPTAVVTGSAPVVNSNQTETPQQTAQTGSEPANQAANVTPAPTANQTGSDPAGKEPQEMVLRRRAQQAEAEAAYYKGLAEGRGSNQTPTPQKPEVDAPPDINNFENYDDFVIAKAKFEFRQEQKQQSEKNATETVDRQYFERFNKAVEKIPDLPEVIGSARIPFHPATLQAIKESELGPQIAYHLAKNPNEAIRISQLSPYAAVREIGKLEVKLTPPPASSSEPQRISQAPEPVKPVPQTGSLITSDYDKMSMEEFMSKRNAAQYGKR